jgi:hypothetical protein
MARRRRTPKPAAGQQALFTPSDPPPAAPPARAAEPEREPEREPGAGLIDLPGAGRVRSPAEVPHPPPDQPSTRNKEQAPMPMPDPPATPTEPTEPAANEPAANEPAGSLRRLVREIASASAAPSRPWQGRPTRLARVALAEAAGLLPRRPTTQHSLTRPADQHQHQHAERGTADDHQHQDQDHDG